MSFPTCKQGANVKTSPSQNPGLQDLCWAWLWRTSQIGRGQKTLWNELISKEKKKKPVLCFSPLNNQRCQMRFKNWEYQRLCFELVGKFNPSHQLKEFSEALDTHHCITAACSSTKAPQISRSHRPASQCSPNLSYFVHKTCLQAALPMWHLSFPTWQVPCCTSEWP